VASYAFRLRKRGIVSPVRKFKNAKSGIRASHSALADLRVRNGLSASVFADISYSNDICGYIQSREDRLSKRAIDRALYITRAKLLARSTGGGANRRWKRLNSIQSNLQRHIIN